MSSLIALLRDTRNTLCASPLQTWRLACFATCLVNAVHTLMMFGFVSSVAMFGFHLTLQSGLLFLVQHRQHASMSSGTWVNALAITLVGMGVGVCLILHAILQRWFDAYYLEYIGAQYTSSDQRVHTVLTFIVVPSLTLVHLLGPNVQPVNVLDMFAFASVDVSLIVLIHEFVVRYDTYILDKDDVLSIPEDVVTTRAEVIWLYVFTLIATLSTSGVADAILRHRLQQRAGEWL